MEYLDVRLTWDKDLGITWMNEDNLKMLLYTQVETRKDLLDVEIKGSSHERRAKKNTLKGNS